MQGREVKLMIKTLRKWRRKGAVMGVSVGGENERGRKVDSKEKGRRQFRGDHRKNH